MNWYPLRRLVLPILLLSAALMLHRELLSLRAAYLQLFDWLPYVTLGGALLLSFFFNLSRQFCTALALAAAYAVIQFQLQTALTEPQTFIVYSMLSFALPLLLFLLLVVPERGLRNQHGFMLAAIAPLLIAAGWWVITKFAGPALALSESWMPLRPLPWMIPSASSAILFAAVALAALFILLRRDREDAATIFAALLFGFVTLMLFYKTKISALLFGAAGLSLAISLLRSSYDMAFRDELTGLLGRRALNDRLKGLGSRYVIAMLDVDHFKNFNDTYGHDVGDDVLKMVAKQIERVTGGGTAYRYGGEEFSIIFPRKDIEDCEPHLEKVRRAVGRYRLALRDSKQREVPKKVAKARRGRRKSTRAAKSVSVTVSIGVAERNDRLKTPEEVIEAADAALYRAKEKGRNCLSR